MWFKTPEPPKPPPSVDYTMSNGCVISIMVMTDGLVNAIAIDNVAMALNRVAAALEKRE